MEDRFKFRFWDKDLKAYMRCVNLDKVFDDKTVIVEQCTGLKDNKGKLIYEGDIIKDLTFNEDLAIIKFGNSDDFCGGYQCFYPEWLGKYSKRSKYSMGWRRGLVWWCNNGIEVVGNIHENPELLER